MKQEFKKLRATVIGPHKVNNLFFVIRATWPFGSIKINENKIIVSPFFFSEEIDKKQIISLRLSKGVFRNGVEVIFTKGSDKYAVVLSPVILNDLLKLLNEFDYKLSS
ncbi:MAG: hypothetical protein EXS46_02960 [Candidatus Taylorbacteria bacterium]|nr:hypothetical protein [Candidatus Taylorbacteria bacterium]